MTRVRLVLFGLIVLAMAGFARAATQSPAISVGILLKQQTVEIGATGTFQLYDGPDREPSTVLPADESVKVTVVRGGLRYLGHTSTAVALVPAVGAHVTVNGRVFRGRLDVRADTHGGLTVINVLDMESYLYGVVRAEMPGNSPFEALKAQAIASRTFALKHRENAPESGYALRCDEISQVYGGIADEDPRTSAAVDQTRGIVVSVDGDLIEASFHASCGGQTENNEDVWKIAPLTYQRGVGCIGCRRQPPPAWKTRLDLNTVATRLRRDGYKVGHIRGIWAMPSRTGRVREVVLQSDKGTVRVPGNAFRMAMNSHQVKSMAWNLNDIALAATTLRGPASSDAGHGIAKQLTISGRGAGHGLGLCQHGAVIIAGMGAKVTEILKAYYSGATLARAY